MKKSIHSSIIKKIAGVVLILIGIPGLFLPLLQGILFITAGFILLGNKNLLKKMKHIGNKIKRYIASFFSRPKR